MGEEEGGPAWTAIGCFEEVRSCLAVSGDEDDGDVLCLVAWGEFLDVDLVEHVLRCFVSYLYLLLERHGVGWVCFTYREIGILAAYIKVLATRCYLLNKTPCSG